MEDASFCKNTGSSSLSGISKNSNQHIHLICKGTMGTFLFQKVVGFESCAVLPVVEALLFAPIVNVCLED
jgi:hypothetical protein